MFTHCEKMVLDPSQILEVNINKEYNRYKKLFLLYVVE